MLTNEITHHIDKYILSVLYKQKIARFSDLKKPKVETNLFSYHLKTLLKTGLITKVSGGYTLSESGLQYVDYISSTNMQIRPQPKIISMLVIQNSNGEILLWNRNKQPYIDTWTLPYGKIHIDDRSIRAAAIRESTERLNHKPTKLVHAGDCYVRVIGDSGQILSSTLAHVSKFNSDKIKLNDTTKWVSLRKLDKFTLAPAVEQIISRVLFDDPYFFEEFTVNWSEKHHTPNQSD